MASWRFLKKKTEIEKLLHGLVEWWWDTTQTFHFDNIGEMMTTSKHFSAITEIRLYGKLLRYDIHAYKDEAWLKNLYGNQFPQLD